MNLEMTSSPIDWEKVIAPAVAAFNEKNYAPLTQLIQSVPESEIERFLTTFMAYTDRACKETDAIVANRRLAQNPKFRRYFVQMPSARSQGLFLANLPNLKTRVSLSFFDHPKIRSKEVDYTIRLADEHGKLVYQHDATICQKQTHTFDCAQILANAKMKYGVFLLDAAEPDVGSLRVYATWYNDRCTTTTHEKAAIATYGPIMIFPTILASQIHETYLTIINTDSKQQLDCECQLLNHKKETHPTIMKFGLKPEGSMMLPVSPYYADIEKFLDGKPGALYVRNNSLRAVYYYFIENKELGSWQIQHL